MSAEKRRGKGQNGGPVAAKTGQGTALVAEEMRHLEEFAEKYSGWLFRGQRSPDWNLETSLERTAKRCGVPKTEYEQECFREFQRHAGSYSVRVPRELSDTLEWLALMQHFGAPTRLLDFTYSFWIALFFAFETTDQDCAVWALDPDSLGSTEGRNFNEVLAKNIATGHGKDSSLYSDVPFFTNDRLAIQKGTFVFSLDMEQRFHDLFVANEKVHKVIRVSSRLFPQIRKRLNDFNCNRRVLFPGIDGFAMYFQNHTYRR
jgi:hypothetical protein